jgi:DNA-binding NtrC family response regulator
MSRRHTEVSWRAGIWTVRDLGSRNGTRVDNRLTTAAVSSTHPPVVRFGRTIALGVADILPFLGGAPMREGDFVAGPTLRAALGEVAATAAAGVDLLLTGESGCGKEVGARHFHRSGPRSRGPFIPVNCAAIPAGIAERLLFGTVKGAYSGASSDALGYVRSADGGVLFLDEFGELDLEVQAKLLRVIETKEAVPVGASRGQRVNVAFCLGTNRNLRSAVSAGKFRDDLYYRVTQSTVRLPPLRERREEVPWLIRMAAEAEAGGVEIEADLVEACMVLPWPGNVRELLGEMRRLARLAKTQSTSLRASLMSPDAGRAVERVADGDDAVQEPASPVRTPVTAPAIEKALREAKTVSDAARSLGIHRSHLYRLIRQFGIDPKLSKGGGSANRDE